DFFAAGAEVFDEATARFVPTPGRPLGGDRRWQAGVALEDGTALVIGGDAGRRPCPDVEQWDPRTGLFRSVGALRVARARAAACSLGVGAGRVVVAGGTDLSSMKGQEIRSLEVFSVHDGAT